jgi:hypothetical protein
MRGDFSQSLSRDRAKTHRIWILAIAMGMSGPALVRAAEAVTKRAERARGAAELQQLEQRIDALRAAGR